MLWAPIAEREVFVGYFRGDFAADGQTSPLCLLGRCVMRSRPFVQAGCGGATPQRGNSSLKNACHHVCRCLGR